MWHYGIWIHSPLTSVGVVHSTWPSRAMWHMHASTFNKWHKKKKHNKNKKVTLHILTHGVMRGSGLTSLVACIHDTIHDRRERNVTIRSEIWTTNICSLGFRDIRAASHYGQTSRGEAFGQMKIQNCPKSVLSAFTLEADVASKRA